MSVKITSNPGADVQPGDVVGKPLRIPAALFCTQGERWCGKLWMANSERQLTERLKERCVHELSCLGGLIIATA